METIIIILCCLNLLAAAYNVMGIRKNGEHMRSELFEVQRKLQEIMQAKEDVEKRLAEAFDSGEKHVLEKVAILKKSTIEGFEAISESLAEYRPVLDDFKSAVDANKEMVEQNQRRITATMTDMRERYIFIQEQRKQGHSYKKIARGFGWDDRMFQQFMAYCRADDWLVGRCNAN